MIKENDLKRVNCWISKKNYSNIEQLMKETTLINMKLSKGAIVDIALTNLFLSLENGSDLGKLAINYLEN